MPPNKANASHHLLPLNSMLFPSDPSSSRSSIPPPLPSTNMFYYPMPSAAQIAADRKAHEAREAAKAAKAEAKAQARVRALLRDSNVDLTALPTPYPSPHRDKDGFFTRLLARIKAWFRFGKKEDCVRMSDGRRIGSPKDLRPIVSTGRVEVGAERDRESEEWEDLVEEPRGVRRR